MNKLIQKQESSTPLKKFHGTKTPGEFHTVVFGDTHINHPNTTTDDTLPILYEITEPTAYFKSLDMIIIEGDFFDSIMYLNNDNLKRIVLWILQLLKKCAKYDIALRVLEGTPSHDMKQPKWFATYNELYKIGADVLYVDDLYIERNSKLGVDILYMPDEWASPIENCYTAAKRYIQNIGETQVDYIVMHGNFEYQLPKVIGLAVHSSKLWQELVRYNIFIGHIHTHSINGKIVATGSTNRLRHGEESPKGWTRAVGYANGTTNITFMPYAKAKVYSTYKVPAVLDTTETIDFIKSKCDNLPDDSHIKFAHGDNVILTSMVNYARLEYPHINFSTKILETQDNQEKTVSMIPKITANVGVDIVKSNISKLLRTEMSLSEKDIDVLNGADATLLELLNEL